VVVGVVGDVAGAVGLLDAADAVLQAFVPGTAHGRASVSRVAQVGVERRLALGVDPVGLGGELRGRGPGRSRCRGCATARSRWRGSRRRAASPACGRCGDAGTASMAASKQSAGELRRDDGTGDSPLRPYIACSRSACSVLVGRPVDGPPRWTSTMTSGSSSITARPIVSALEREARPGGRGHAERAAEAAPRAAPMPAISSSAWKVVTPKRLCREQLVQDVAGRGDRVAAEEQRHPARWRAATSP
jgi:hypothetical protein